MNKFIVTYFFLHMKCLHIGNATRTIATQALRYQSNLNVPLMEILAAWLTLWRC